MAGDLKLLEMCITRDALAFYVRELRAQLAAMPDRKAREGRAGQVIAQNIVHANNLLNRIEARIGAHEVRP